MSFEQGDVEDIRFKARFDVMMCSLVFKHLYPTFQAALQSIASAMKPEGKLFFDLIEATRGAGSFEDDGVTWVRKYTRTEVHRLLGKAELDFVAFERVEHCVDRVRLLVVARKST